jgi:hypothetical protein
MFLKDPDDARNHVMHFGARRVSRRIPAGACRASGWQLAPTPGARGRLAK